MTEHMRSGGGEYMGHWWGRGSEFKNNCMKCTKTINNVFFKLMRHKIVKC